MGLKGAQQASGPECQMQVTLPQAQTASHVPNCQESRSQRKKYAHEWQRDTLLSSSCHFTQNLVSSEERILDDRFKELSNDYTAALGLHSLGNKLQDNPPGIILKSYSLQCHTQY